MVVVRDPDGNSAVNRRRRTCRRRCRPGHWIRGLEEQGRVPVTARPALVMYRRRSSLSSRFN
ncbi:hypothetical protein P4132_22500 [Pseudomonas aeruginosa]|nr:hypothetical protein [Pseudomonas aeruginosa]